MKNTKSSPGATVVDPLANSRLGRRLAALHAGGSTSQRELSAYILRNPIKVAAASIEDLARATGVSAPTISRFVRELGLDGFADLRGTIAEALQAVLDPVAKLREQLHGASARGAPGATFEAARGQIALMDAAETDRQCRRVANRVAKARSVHVMGFGLSAHVAGLLVLGLQPYHPAVAAVVEFGGTEVAAGRLMAIGKADLVIAITFPRYANDIVNLSRFARDKGGTIVGITDSMASPLAPLADDLVLAPSNHAVLSSSMVAGVAIVETIVSMVMLSDPANAQRADALSKAIATYLFDDKRAL